jgi:exosortase A-associated hydrolase 1
MPCVITGDRMSTVSEVPIVFECHGDRLIGIATQPSKIQSIGVLIIVGGPQYRSGSHRQFTLLARRLAQEGFASLRFDYRGMGDSEGDMRYFEAINDDIRSAIDAFQRTNPAVQKVALWGLCDAASAALYYAYTDPRIIGQVLLNPWTHSQVSAAKARLKHYYLTRLMQKSFWIKLLTGGIKVSQSVGGLKQSAQQASITGEAANSAPTDPRHGSTGYIDRMLAGLISFKGRTQILLSGQDLVAQEFIQLKKSDKAWAKASAQARVQQVSIEKANHTFSSAVWRAEAEAHTLTWLRQQSGNN